MYCYKHKFINLSKNYLLCFLKLIIIPIKNPTTTTSIVIHKFVARGQGFEPRLTGPEPVVLPLDDPRKLYFFITNNL